METLERLEKPEGSELETQKFCSLCDWCDSTGQCGFLDRPGRQKEFLKRDYCICAVIKGFNILRMTLTEIEVITNQGRQTLNKIDFSNAKKLAAELEILGVEKIEDYPQTEELIDKNDNEEDDEFVLSRPKRAF